MSILFVSTMHGQKISLKMGLACRVHGKRIKIIGMYPYRPITKTSWVKFEVFMRLNMKIPVIWDETLWRYVELDRPFGRRYCVYLEGTKWECTLHVKNILVIELK